MIRAEFLINTAIANNVKDDDDQLMSDSHDGFLFAAASPHATIQRRKMRVLLVARRPSRLAENPSQVTIAFAGFAADPLASTFAIAWAQCRPTRQMRCILEYLHIRANLG